MTGDPFREPGDSFFDQMVIWLAPVDDFSVMYTAENAANFRDVFGRNTFWVIDPEEAMADNFSIAIFAGLDGQEYENPEIIVAIDAYLKVDHGVN